MSLKLYRYRGLHKRPLFVIFALSLKYFIVMDINFLKCTAVDGRNLAINLEHIVIIEDKGDTISIKLGDEWQEVALTLDDFIRDCHGIEK